MSKCQLCEDTIATLFCKQCQENFCSECFEALHYSGKRQGHEVVPIGGDAPAPAAYAPPAANQFATQAPAPEMP
ncbi:hypothetical protein T484DRAFT_1868850, partial [Baffinella frigidus]